MASYRGIKQFSRPKSYKRRGMRGGNSALAQLKDAIRGAPLTIAHEVARQASPMLTGETRAAFASGAGVYGDPRPMSKMTGAPLTLVKTGLTRDLLRFATAGTIVRCVLAKNYMRYLIGKYTVLPNGAMPVTWKRKLDGIVQAVRL
jgi:hypothetical protein